MKLTNNKQLESAVTGFMGKFRVSRQNWLNKMGITYKQASISFKEGSKYIKFIDEDGGVSAFVDYEGNIYKAATWRTPALHVRGNVYSSDNGMEAVDSRSFIKYLR